MSQFSPSLPWKLKIVLFALSTVTDLSRRQNGTVNRRLINFFELRASPKSTPVNGVKTSDVTVDPSRNLWFRLFEPTQVPEGGEKLPVIVFFHGGGFAFLSAATRAYDAVCRRFARKLPAVVVSVEYRLSPEHRYPAQYEDGFDVLKYLDSHPPANSNLSSCFLAGDSAGANIAHHVAVRACETTTFREVKVVGLIAIQPYFGGEERTESENRLEGSPLVSMTRTDWLWKAFLPEGADRDHEATNVSGPGGRDLSKVDFPATMVVVGGFDPLQDWQRRYYEWLKRSGKEVRLLEYGNAIHAFYLFPSLPEWPLLLAEVKTFVQQYNNLSGIK